MIFIKGISKFNRQLKSYMVELSYGSSERNVTLELFDTKFNKAYTIGLNKLISEYYTRNTEFGVDNVFNSYKLKRDMPIYGFSIKNDNELSCFTCDNMLKKGLFDKFDFKVTELSQESPAQAIDVGGVDTDTGVIEKSHHVLTLFVDLYVNDKFLILPTENGYHYYIKNNGHYFDVEVTPKEKVNMSKIMIRLITLSSVSSYFQAS